MTQFCDITNIYDQSPNLELMARNVNNKILINSPVDSNARFFTTQGQLSSKEPLCSESLDFDLSSNPLLMSEKNYFDYKRELEEIKKYKNELEKMIKNINRLYKKKFKKNEYLYNIFVDFKEYFILFICLIVFVFIIDIMFRR